MDIIFKGQHTGDELAKSIADVVQIFKKRYHVPAFREIYLKVTLVDESDKEVELMDDKDDSVYRRFEVYRCQQELNKTKCVKRAMKKPTLVVNNKR